MKFYNYIQMEETFLPAGLPHTIFFVYKHTWRNKSFCTILILKKSCYLIVKIKSLYFK